MKTKLFYRSLILIVLVTMAIFGVKTFTPASFFPIKKVTIKGDYTEADQNHLQQLLMPYVKKSFFTVSVVTIERELENIDWIKNSQISMRWPDQIIITIQQREPLAHWNNDALISEDKKIFHRNLSSNNYKNLPYFFGADQHREIVISTYLTLQTQLTPLDLMVDKLSLNEQDVWQIELSNGIQLIMKKDQSMTPLQKFLQTYQQSLYKKAEDIDYVDLRYNNGFAVSWKKTHQLRKKFV